MLNAKSLILLAAAIFTGTAAIDAVADTTDNPVAAPGQTVTCGNARFTVLTPQLVRMEWNADGKWEDHKSLTFINRNLDVPKFKSSTNAKGATINTGALTLTYKNDGKPFDAKNLKIVFPLNGKKVTWTPGTVDSLNLKGTTRTLDGTEGNKLGREPMEDGLLSHSGWALVDDSGKPVLMPTDSHWKEWVAERPNAEGTTDWYFFAYGHDYKQALADYQRVAGRAMLPPKYVFGYWWSRYWQYSDDEMQDIVQKLRSLDIPIDVLIVDMDWHDTFGLTKNNPKRDEYGQRVGWTGYTWQKQLFPNPANFLEWTNREHLKTALNLHPASGIQPNEECYDAFTAAYGWTEKGKGVPFKIDEEKWTDTYFSTVLDPMEKMGVDFWWLDWQQWVNSKYTKGLSNTFWLNHTFYNHAKETAATDAEGLTQRPLIYHRWGGLGSHRYPLGFSGDTYTNWSTLAFLPWFTSTSSNVNYGYWGHDIGGHMFRSKVKSTDPELYLRWLQYGVFTPIFKTHSTKDRRIVRYPWAFPDHQFMLRDAIQLRYALVPYIYNAARANYDTGVAMSRPMYYEYPELDKAYNVPEQFFFGDDIIATTVCHPIDSVTGLAERTVWLPEGKWYDYATGKLYTGETDLKLEYTLDENPFYVRAGAIIPMNPASVRSLQVPCDTLVLTFIPGAEGKLTHYEDDGETNAYIDGGATTTVTKTLAEGAINVTIAARQGTYHNAPAARAYELRFPATMPPAKVTVAGKEYPYARFPQPGTWSYDGMSLQPVVYTETLPVDADINVALTYNEGNGYDARLFGKKEIFHRCRSLTPEFKEEQCRNGENYIMLPEGYLKVSQCANFILENPQGIDSYLNDFDAAYSALPEIIANHKYSGEKFRTRIAAQLEFAK
jgi:alpha-glucosidase (family GH31 glycosyl hydrolase)